MTNKDNEEQPKCKASELGPPHMAWRLESGKLHRMNGPAVEWQDGDEWWYIHDERVPTTQLELSIGQTISWYNSVALVIKQINPILFQVIVGNKKEYLFSLYNTKYKRAPGWSIS